MRLFVLRLFFATFALFLLAACGGTPEQFYRLRADAPAPLTGGGLSVGIGPVTLPGYVDRAELVFQSDDYQLQIPASVKWGGTLNENFTRALATNVAARLGSGNVVPYPFPTGPGGQPRVQVTVSVQQFHAVSGAEAILEVSWRVRGRVRNARYTERIVGDGYGAVVAAESRLVARLADAVAASVR